MSITSLNYTATEIKLIVRIFKKLQKESPESSYLYKLAKEVNTSVPATRDNLQRLKEKKLVDVVKARLPEGRRGPVQYYRLTPPGQDFAKAILQNPTMVRLLEKQGIIEREGLR